MGCVVGNILGIITLNVIHLCAGDGEARRIFKERHVVEAGRVVHKVRGAASLHYSMFLL